MRKLIFTASLFLIFLSSQAQIKPMVSASYSALLGTSAHSNGFQEFQLGGGIVLDNHFSIQLNYRYTHFGYFRFQPKSSWLTPMKTNILSLSTNYRLWSIDRVVSPMVMLDVGLPFKSNANGAIMDLGYLIYPKYSPGAYRYNRGLFFGKLKALCDIQLQAFNLQFGASFNLWYENVSWLIGNEEGSYFVSQTKVIERYNFGLEAGLMYTIPTKREKKE